MGESEEDSRKAAAIQKEACGHLPVLQHFLTTIKNNPAHVNRVQKLELLIQWLSQP